MSIYSMKCIVKTASIGHRRHGLALGLASAWALAGLPTSSLAAAQEADLADAIRAVLGQRWRASGWDLPLDQEAGAWCAQTEERLMRWMPDGVLRQELSRSVWYEARRAGLSLSLVLGLIEVESGFRKHAISSAGAVGYMQIMPFWVRAIGDGDLSALLRTSSNLRYGCVILRHYLNSENGQLALALGRYNGSRGQPEYPARVLAAAQAWRRPYD